MFDISEVRIRKADEADKGLVAWASCVLNNALYINNIAIRKDRDGQLFLTFPAKKSRKGIKYFYFRPINSATKELLDNAIIQELKDLLSE